MTNGGMTRSQRNWLVEHASLNKDPVIIELVLPIIFKTLIFSHEKKILIEIHQPSLISLNVSPIQAFIWANYYNS